MRFLPLVPFLVTLFMPAQPVDRPHLHPSPVPPSILHVPIRTGVPVPDTYFAGDTIVVRITAHVLLDGSCEACTALYGIQQLEGKVWKDLLIPIRRKASCTMSDAQWLGQVVGIPRAHGRPWASGTYRLMVMCADGNILPGAPFHVR